MNTPTSLPQKIKASTMYGERGSRNTKPTLGNDDQRRQNKRNKSPKGAAPTKKQRRPVNNDFTADLGESQFKYVRSGHEIIVYDSNDTPVYKFNVPVQDIANTVKDVDVRLTRLLRTS